jgi:lipoate-protein ligase A
MALDEVLFRDCLEGSSPVLRLYGWDPPGLSLGRFQKEPTGLDLDFCRRAGILPVRRMTGGRAVLHHREVTYSLTSRYEPPFGESGIIQTYSLIARGLASGLAGLGIPVEVAGRRSGKGSGTPDCFRGVSVREITSGGRKLVGSAQVRERFGFLQHGSILISVDRELWADVFPDTRPAPLESGIESILERPVGTEEVEEAILKGFKDNLGLDLAPGRLTGAEERQAEGLAEEKYRDLDHGIGVSLSRGAS